MVSLAEKNDYLKKYLSNDSDKKKKKSKKSHGSGLLIEEDVAFAKVAPGSSINRRNVDSNESGSDNDEIVELKQQANSKKASGFIADSFQIIGSPRDRIDSPDLSPQRKSKTSDQEYRKSSEKYKKIDETKRTRNDSSDLSPPRKRSTRDLSPPRRRRNDSSDLSPPRKRQESRNTRESHRRNDSPDLSPPRKRQHSLERKDNKDKKSHRSELLIEKDTARTDRIESPTRKIKKEADLSPSRRRRNDSSDEAPPRRRRNDSPSPVRKIKKEADLSPPRRRRNDSGSPARKIKKETDLSPPRRRRNDSGSPPPRRRRNDSVSPVRSNQKKKEASPEQNQVRRKRLTREQEAQNTRESQKQAELNEKYKAVSGGVAQAEARQQKLKEMEQVVQENFTRYADDKSMNEHLKEQLLGEDDPMNEYMSKKNMKIRMKSESVYPTYNGQFPPNRYSIAPGYRWDGVDRSNGFESKMSMRANRQKAEDSAAYRINAEMAE